MATPPLPPGFQIVQEDATGSESAALPPLPPGFQLESPVTELPTVYAQRPDFSQVTSAVDTTAAMSPRGTSIASPGPAAGQSPRKAPSTPNASLFRMDSDFTERSGASFGQMLWAAAKDMFGSREGAAKYLAQSVGGTVGRDRQGQPILSLKDGTAYRLNDEGFDSTDAANIAGNVAAMWTPAGWAGKAAQARNLGLTGRVALQGVTAGATDAALQAATSEGNVDPVRALAATAGGGAGEVLGTAAGAAINRLATLARNGTARTKATATLSEAGAPVTEASINRLLPLMEQLRNGANKNALLGQSEYGLQYTLGQRLTNADAQFRQLSREEVLRQTPGGGGQFRQLNDANTEAVGNALADITQRFGGRAAQAPAEMADSAAVGLRQQAGQLRSQVDDAYDAVRNASTTAVTPEAVIAIPARMRQAVREFDINPQTTPATARALEQIGSASQAITANPAGGSVKGVTLRALEAQRRILGNAVGTAANPTDRAAMNALKSEFDGWMDQAIDASLATGEREALELLKTARSLRAEYGRRFEGGADSDKFIAGILDGTRSPEELVNIALGAGQVSKSGAARFIDRLRTAAADNPEVIGGLRGAHFTRMTRGNNGEALTPGQIVRNIRSTEYSNASVVKALYAPEQWSEVRRFAAALEPLVARGDFAKSSGSAERLVRAFMDQFVPNVPLVGNALSGIRGGMDAIRAGRAINAPVTAAPTPLPAFPSVMSASADEAAR